MDMQVVQNEYSFLSNSHKALAQLVLLLLIKNKSTKIKIGKLPTRLDRNQVQPGGQTFLFTAERPMNTDPAAGATLQTGRSLSVEKGEGWTPPTLEGKRENPDPGVDLWSIQEATALT
jgi:hypothetical protein